MSQGCFCGYEEMLDFHPVALAALARGLREEETSLTEERARQIANELWRGGSVRVQLRREDGRRFWVSNRCRCRLWSQRHLVGHHRR